MTPKTQIYYIDKSLYFNTHYDPFGILNLVGKTTYLRPGTDFAAETFVAPGESPKVTFPCCSTQTDTH